ncbi:SIMPL domain-containing protein [Phenylobacterium montanum]|uniref:SIMPL domain-containing protein n=1 Tax=Phenylobacterium montanum TaxID=2823693 RepID=A0A975IWB1_9CAUL|nr:SIMPL domain-containing protein [Caulobacter sp. S6]QUD89688.1 SIMPL domain-containing protein [Caulobacter sp. S6]
MTRPLAPAIFAALALAGLAGAARAQTVGAQADEGGRAFDATTLSLSAEGEAEARPDQATITLGVQVKAPSARQAMADNAQRMSQVIAALKSAGLEAKDIQTSNLSLNPAYDYGPNRPPKLTGYEADNEVRVTVNDLARLGPVVDAVVNAGADQVSGISFGLKDPRAAEDRARKSAVQALAAKAELYAAETGYRLKRLVNLTEGGGYQPGPVRPMLAFAAKAAAAPTPVEQGQLTVRIDISGVYELSK